MTTRSPRRSTPSRGGVLRSPFVWLLGLVGVALVIALAVTGGDDAADTTGETAEVAVTGAPLGPLLDPDPAIGTIVPGISARTFDGDTVDIDPATEDGPARLYAFLAHWCPHCQAEVPRVAAWLDTNELPEDVEIVAISTAVDSTADNYPPSEWFAREGWPTPVLMDDPTGSLAAAFGLTGFPYWVATDATGAVVSRASGELTTPEFEALVASIA